jgi:hypothetical protein
MKSVFLQERPDSLAYYGSFGAFRHTREQARQRKQVLLVQDTTDLNYSQHPKTKGLGPIGRSRKAQGFFLQSVLAVDA